MKSFWQQDFACHRTTELNKPWACGIRLTWKPFPLLVLQCFEPWGPSSSLRGACAVLQRALHLYSRLLLSLVLSVVGTAGAPWCVAPWRVSGYFNYSCRLYRTNTATVALEKGWGKKEQFIGVDIGLQAKQSNKLQKTIFLLWKSHT